LSEPILILADIIQNQMALSPGQVMLAYQKFNIPTTGLLVILSYVGPNVIIGSSDVFVDDAGVTVATPFTPFQPGVPIPVPTGGLTEVQSVTLLYEVQIDIMSFNNDNGTNDARTRKEEIVMALNSLYSEQSQENNQMQVSQVPGPFIDTSFLEATQYLQRYTTRVKLTAATTKTQAAPYYNDLSRAVPPILTANA
jgi:hypothetical protein